MSAQDAAGNESSAAVTVTWVPDRVLAVLDAPEQQEGRRINATIQLESQGDVGGISFALSYDPEFLSDPELTWAAAAGSALTQVKYDVPGEVRVSFALPATTIPAGAVPVATVSFRARSVPLAMEVGLALQVQDVAGPDGNLIAYGTDTREGTARILKRRVTGDNNANDRLDVGDATVLQRLLLELDVPRTWDVAANDVNASSSLDSGDIIRVLRAVVGLDPQPRVQDAQLVVAGQAARMVLRVEPVAGVRQAEPTERAVLMPPEPGGAAGDLVTVTVVAANVTRELAGASFSLVYPVEALRLLNSQSHRAGDLVPGNAVAVWNVAPARNDYAAQNGRIVFAASSPTAWPARDGALAEFTFQVQPEAATQHRWPLELIGLEFTENGYDNRLPPPAGLYFIGRDPVAPTLDAGASGMTAQGFKLVLHGEQHVNYVIEVSENLKHWEPLRSMNHVDGTLEVIDDQLVNRNQRFYRAKQAE